MEEFLSPVGNKHPNAHIADQSKRNPKQKKAEVEYEEGTEEIPLPSKGVFYSGLGIEDEVLHCRPLDFRDEDILTTQRFIEDGTVFDKIVSAVIQDEGITAGKLVPIDRDTILIWLRANALGKDMHIEYTCANPICREKNTATWDLSQIKILEYDPEIFAELKENGELKIVTPQKEVVVYIRVPFIEESKDTEKRFLKQKELKNIEHDLLASATLSMMVSGVEHDGKVIRRKADIMEHFKKIKLPLGDSRYIRKQAEKINLQYDTKQDLVCKKCGDVQTGVELPIVHQNFLWVNE